jgi:hypothetical protein
MMIYTIRFDQNWPGSSHAMTWHKNGLFLLCARLIKLQNWGLGIKCVLHFFLQL